MVASMLGSGELSSLRSGASLLLTQTATIVRRATQDDGMGGMTEVWAPTGAPVSCRVVYGSPGEAKLLAEKVTESAGCSVYVLFDADVTKSDRLIINGTTYEIHGILMSDPIITKRCVCRAL